MPIASDDAKAVEVASGLIRDVGYAKDDSAIQYNIVRVNGNRSVYCPLLREPGENTIAVVDAKEDKLVKLVKAQGLLINGGYGKIKGATFRLSNMGDETDQSMEQLYAALDQSLGKL